MGKQQFLQFRDAVLKSETLKQELASSIKSPADLLAMGKRLGYAFDASDVDSSVELTEDDVKAVAGGEGGWEGLGGGTSKMNVFGKGWSDIGTFNSYLTGVLFPK